MGKNNSRHREHSQALGITRFPACSSLNPVVKILLVP